MGRLSDIWCLFYPLLKQSETLIPMYDHLCLIYCDSACMAHLIYVCFFKQKIQKLETSLREAKESATHKESKIIKMQKELEMTNNVLAKAQVNESNKCLEKAKEMIQVLQVT